MYKYLNEPSKSFLMIRIGVHFAVLGLAITMVGTISIENISITLALFTRSSATVHCTFIPSHLRPTRVRLLAFSVFVCRIITSDLPQLCSGWLISVQFSKTVYIKK